MIAVLRFVGVMNAAIWLGSLVFFTLGAGPAFFSPEMLDIFGGRTNPYARAWAGQAAQIVLERYFSLQLICSAVALAHLIAEWLYVGRRPQRRVGWLLATLFGIGLLGGFWLQPKLKGLHVIRYGVRSTAEQRVEAAKSFRFWHACSQAVNLIVMGGVGFYFWRTVNRPDAVRFLGNQSSPVRN